MKSEVFISAIILDEQLFFCRLQFFFFKCIFGDLRASSFSVCFKVGKMKMAKITIGFLIEMERG